MDPSAFCLAAGIPLLLLRAEDGVHLLGDLRHGLGVAGRSEDGEYDVGEEELRRARLLPHDGHARVEHRARVLRIHLRRSNREDLGLTDSMI